MRRSKLITVGISALLLSAILAPPAQAVPPQVPPGGTGAGLGTDGVIVIGARDEVSVGGGGRTSGGQPGYQGGNRGSGNRGGGNRGGDSDDESNARDAVAAGAAEVACAGLWGWEVPACLANQTQEAANAVLQQAAIGEAPAPPDPVVIAAELREQLQLPSPQIRTSPAHERTSAVVGLPTWLWIDPGSWQAMTESVTAIDVTVTVVARPVEVVWETGDGATVTCGGPGTPFIAGRYDARAASPDCGHTYRRASTGGPHTVTASVRWAVDYDVTGAPGGGSLDDVLLSDSISLRVVEVQTIN